MNIFQKSNETGNNIFLSQSKNILNKENDNKMILLNENKNELNSKNINDTKNNIDNKKNVFQTLSLMGKNEIKKEEEKNNLNINNNIDNNLILTNDELFKYENMNASHKLVDEVVNDFKKDLYKQKEIFNACANNTRILEFKYDQLLKSILNNFIEKNNIEKKYIELLSNIKDISKDTYNLENNLNIENKKLENALKYINNNKNNNSDLFIQRADYEEKNNCYKEIQDIQKKTDKIENNLKIISNMMEKNVIKRSVNEQESLQDFINKNDNNQRNEILNNTEGIIVERNQKQIYIDQNQFNILMNDFYNILNGLQNEQNEIDKKYEKLKNNLIIRQNKNNNI